VAHRRLRGLSSHYWGGDPTAHMDELWLEDEPGVPTHSGG